MTTCFYELCFVLREPINDKLHVIYIVGNIAELHLEGLTGRKCQF